jgi:hypothetical protein
MNALPPYRLSGWFICASKAICTYLPLSGGGGTKNNGIMLKVNMAGMANSSHHWQDYRGQVGLKQQLINANAFP